MKFVQIWIIIIMDFTRISAGDKTDIEFIKSFIINEQKPTILFYDNLCWSTHRKTKLVNALSKSGFRSSGTSVVTTEHLYHNLLFLLNLDCPNVSEVIYNAISRKLFASPFRWLILSSSTNGTALPLVLNSPILVDSDVVLAERVETGYKLTELYKTSLSAETLTSPRGYYNGTFIDLRPCRSLFRKRRDVMGHILTMSNVIQDSNTTQYHLPREDRLEPQYDSIAKICWMEVRLAFQMLNATPRYIFSHRWGYKQAGRWSGMINDLHTGRADLGTNCLVSDKERLDVVTYTDMVAPFRVRFVFRQPPLSYVANIYSLPFATSVWVAIFICAAVSTVSLLVATKWENSIERSPTQLDGSVGDALLLTMSAVSQQGCVLEPRKFSGRIMVWVLFAALMSLYAAYSANIVVLLQAPSHSIRSLAQLAESTVTLAANDVDYNHFVFSLYKDPVRVKIYKKIDPEKGKGQFYDINEGVERIRQGLFAFHSIVEPVYRRIEETFLETEKCDLEEVDLLNGFDPFIPVRKESPYLELLRVVFKQIRESGIQSCLVRRQQVSRPRCASTTATFSSVGLRELRPVLYFMLYGAGLSLAILMAERAVYTALNTAKGKSRRSFVTSLPKLRIKNSIETESQ